MAALTIDGGRMYLARTQLQATADASALAAASAMLTNAGITNDYMAVKAEGYVRANQVAVRHEVMGDPHNLATTNVIFGRLDSPEDPNDPFNTATTNYNAAKVVAQRTTQSVDGPVKLLLALIWGNQTADVGASAIAVLDDRMSGFRPMFGNLMPFTINVGEYENQKQYGTDQHGYDGELAQVTAGSDSVPEVKLYPYKLNGSSETTQEEFEGSGNFGILNIGVENQGQPPVETQIDTGVTSDDLVAEVGTPDLTFFDDEGDPQAYEITGNPGLQASLSSVLNSKIGQVVGHFVHDAVVLDGSNAIYHVVGIRFGRVMAVNLNGNNKHLILQPVLYSGPDIVTDPDAPATDLAVSRLKLAR
jgi:hypothetical protein